MARSSKMPDLLVDDSAREQCAPGSYLKLEVDHPSLQLAMISQKLVFDDWILAQRSDCSPHVWENAGETQTAGQS